MHTDVKSGMQAIPNEDSPCPHENSTDSFGRTLTVYSEAYGLALVERLRGRLSTTENSKILRATSFPRIMSGWSTILGKRIAQEKIIGADGVASAEDDEEVCHAEADALFYSVSEVKGIDVFVSHSWSAPRWRKHLALCYYNNAASALCAALATWLLVAALQLTGHLAEPTLRGAAIKYLPMLSFIVVFFRGQRCRPYPNSKNVWLDILCIHQTRDSLKSAGVSAVPEFVTISDRLLVLWSDNYFERLWCNSEIATFCIMNGIDKVDFIPLWLAPWVLIFLLLEALSGVLGSAWSSWAPWQYWSFSLVHALPHAEFCLRCTVAYVPAEIAACASFRRLVKLHDSMVRQLQTYRLQEAKCTVMSDRSVVEEQIKQLMVQYEKLKTGDSPPIRNPIKHFNMFMRNTFKDYIIERVGRVSQLPYSAVVVIHLPLFFIFSAKGCLLFRHHGRVGGSAAAVALHGYMEAAICAFGAAPTVNIIMLQAVAHSKRFAEVSRGMELLVNFVIVVACLLLFIFQCLALCLITDALTDSIGWWSYLGAMSAIFVWNYYMFVRRKSHGRSGRWNGSGEDENGWAPVESHSGSSCEEASASSSSGC